MERSLDWRKIAQVIDGLRTQKELLVGYPQKDGTSADGEKRKAERLRDIERQIEEYTADLKRAQEALKVNKHPMYYADYLCLDTLLSAQLPESDAVGKHAHDETLFIIIHQTYELWFKQILHEMGSVSRHMSQPFVPGRSIGRVVHHLQRVVQILRILVSQIEILNSMTPLDFMDFRDFLFPASGFQSFQFRLLEIRLGFDARRRQLHDQRPYHARLAPEHQKMVMEAEQQSSVFSLLEAWLERTPFLSADLQGQAFDFWQTYIDSVKRMFDADREVILANAARHTTPAAGGDAGSEGADVEQHLKRLEESRTSFLSMFDEQAYNEQVEKGNKRLSFKATKAALLIFLYQDEAIMQSPYQLLQLLIDMDEQMTAWRYKHAMMVQRMLGSKIGTGGSSGYYYLRETVNRGRVFMDLANLATFLIPRKSLPPLPASVTKSMGFSWENEAATKTGVSLSDC